MNQSLWRFALDLQSHCQNLHHPRSCRWWYLRSLLKTKTRREMRRTRAMVEATDTMDVKLVMVET